MSLWYSKGLNLYLYISSLCKIREGVFNLESCIYKYGNVLKYTFYLGEAKKSDGQDSAPS